MRRDVLWLLAILTFGVGDLLTTAVGFHVGLMEANPVYAGLETVAHPLLYALAGKTAFIMLALAAYRLVPKSVSVGIPIGLCAVGVGVTAWNTFLILSVA